MTRIIYVGIKDNPDSEEVANDLTLNREVGKTLLRKYGTDMVEEVYPEENTENGKLGMKILISLGDFGTPKLAVLKEEEGKVCELRLNDFKESKCARYQGELFADEGEGDSNTK